MMDWRVLIPIAWDLYHVCDTGFFITERKKGELTLSILLGL
jgi:hypothetical protein